MSKELTESLARYEAAGHAATKHWWPREQALRGLASLVRQLSSAGPDARLVCQKGLKEDGTATVWLHVEHGPGEPARQTRSHDDDPMDQSHPCPPFCP